MEKYILYARLAVDDQTGKGLIKQVNSVQRYARQNHLQIGKVISEIGSGTNENRKGFKDLLRSISRKKFKGVICQDIARLSRSVIMFQKLSKLIKENNMDIVTM